MSTTTDSTHPALARFPLMEKPFVGFLLAFMAGSLNAWTLMNAETFATVQSGNVLSSGYWLIQGDIEKFTFPFVSVLAFGLGSLACGVLMTVMLRRKKVYTPVVLFISAAILIVLVILAITKAIDPHYIAYGVSFVAGAQGNAYHKTHGMLYGNVAVTFVVQMAFNFLVQSLFSKTGIQGRPTIMWSGIFFLILLGFALGGGIGFLADTHLFNGAAMCIPVVIAVALAIISLSEPKKFVGIDPTPGGQF